MRAVEPSGLTLLGLVRHMADTERYWFRRQFAAAHIPAIYGLNRGVTMDLRWVFLHMIEEYALHNGHADILRERIDGVTGV